MIDTYKKEIKGYQKLIKSDTFISTWIGIIKLILVVLSIYLLYKTIETNIEYGYYFMVSLACFIGFWFWQEYVKKKIQQNDHAILLYKKHIQRIQGDWITFEDTGEEYLDNDHLYANDLDVIGKKSLFQLLNITNTYYGRKQIIKDLLFPKYSKEEVAMRQEAIHELYEKHEFVLETERSLYEIGTSDKIIKIIDVLKTKYISNIPSSIEKSIKILPLIMTSLFVIGLYYRIFMMVCIGGVGIIIQGITWIASIPKIQNRLQIISKLPFNLREYNHVFSNVYKQKFNARKLKEMQEVIGDDDHSIVEAMKGLEQIVSMISLSGNILLYGLFNILFLWDIRCFIRFYKWQEKYAESCENWFMMIGELESLMCFSILPIVVNHTCMPTIADEKNTIDVKQLGHPLLHNDKRICNDYLTRQQIHIISGSNMSGKTTFMRTVGINLLLAEVGSYVCATKMQTSIFTLASSMRIIDNLNEGISTFYAELKNIKKILDIARKEDNVFFMIDEIFRGTNSKDRLDGAKMVLEQLAKLQATGIITTHDLELCHLEKGYQQMINYHFSEEYTDEGIIFSYTIKNGISTTTNAKYLMRMLGIV